MRALSFASADTVGGNFSMLLILAAAVQKNCANAVDTNSEGKLN